MKFFKTQDFEYDSIYIEDMPFIRAEYAANRANEKLEKEAKIVYSYNGPGFSWIESGKNDNFNNAVFKALLINAELIEKCKHKNVPMVVWGGHFKNGAYLKCERGAKLIPTAFKELYND